MTDDAHGDRCKAVRCLGELKAPSHRTKLPATMPSKNEFSVWNIFKHFVGKDLTKITMPVILNEPISFEQRLCEYLEYSELLDRAACTDDPLERFEWVLAFTIASNASSEARLQKPFNPVLGETYEYARFPNRLPRSNGAVHTSEADDNAQDTAGCHANGDATRPSETCEGGSVNSCFFRGFRYVSEQVSHHPPVSAFYAEQLVHVDDAENERVGWTLSGAVEPKVKFWGKLFEVEPRGLTTLTLTKYNETYTWVNPGFFVHNVLLGFARIWVEIQGDPEIRCVQSGWHARVHYEKASGGFFDTRPRAERLHRVTAVIADADGLRKGAVYGKWAEAVYAVSCETHDRLLAHPERFERQPEANRVFDLQLPAQRCLWKVSHKLSDATNYYNFTEFGLQLNDAQWPDWYVSVAPQYRRSDENLPEPCSHSDGVDPTRRTLLPHTDSRWRGDMRIMECHGDLDAAGVEKGRIEEKQREARRRRGKKEFTPLWFRAVKRPSSNEFDWLFTHDYWLRDWSKAPDLF